MMALERTVREHFLVNNGFDILGDGQKVDIYAHSK